MLHERKELLSAIASAREKPLCRSHSSWDSKRPKSFVCMGHVWLATYGQQTSLKNAGVAFYQCMGDNVCDLISLVQVPNNKSHDQFFDFSLGLLFHT